MAYITAIYMLLIIILFKDGIEDILKIHREPLGDRVVRSRNKIVDKLLYWWYNIKKGGVKNV